MAGNYIQAQPGVTNPYGTMPQQGMAYNAGGYMPGAAIGPQMAPQPMPVQPTPQNGYNRPNALLGWPVGSKEEALAAPTDLSGQPMYFPDRAHGAVYFKQLDFQTGASAQDVYYNAAAWQAMQAQLQQVAQPALAAQPAGQYVPIERFDALAKRLSELEEWRAQLEGPAEGGTK